HPREEVGREREAAREGREGEVEIDERPDGCREQAEHHRPDRDDARPRGGTRGDREPRPVTGRGVDRDERLRHQALATGALAIGALTGAPPASGVSTASGAETGSTASGAETAW